MIKVTEKHGTLEYGTVFETFEDFIGWNFIKTLSNGFTRPPDEDDVEFELEPLPTKKGKAVH